MGVATILTVVSTVASTYMQGKAEKKASRARSQAAAERTEVNAINQASSRNQERASRRKGLRDERVRRAQIQQSAENTGGAGSSGETSAGSVLQTTLASSISSQTGTSKAQAGSAAHLAAAGQFDTAASTALTKGASQASIIKTVGGIAVKGIDAGLFD